MPSRNLYTWTGLSLLISGAAIFLTAYFILNQTWLSALGISLLILSFILLALARTIPRLSPEMCNLFLTTGIANTASILEELGIKTKAIYLPSSLTSDLPKALIPLHSNPALPQITRTIPQRLIVRYGSAPDDIGLLVSTIGSTAIGMLETKPTLTELESALNSMLVGILGVADRASVTHHDKQIEVEINNHRLENKTAWSNYCLGEPLASIVATVVAEALNKTVTIKKEEHRKGKYHIELEVMGEGIQ